MEGLGLGGKEWTGGQATSGFRCIGKALLGWAGLDADETKQARRDEKQDDGDYDEKDELEKHDKDGAKVGRAEKQLVDDCGDQAGDYKPKRNSLIQRAAGQASHDSGEETDDPTGSLGTQPGGRELKRKHAEEQDTGNDERGECHKGRSSPWWPLRACHCEPTNQTRQMP